MKNVFTMYLKGFSSGLFAQWKKESSLNVYENFKLQQMNQKGGGDVVQGTVFV